MRQFFNQCKPKMQKLLFLWALAALFCLSNCDQTNPAQKELLIGQWQFSNGSLNGNPEFAAQNYAQYQLIFSPEGKMSSQILTDLENTETLPYKIEGDKIVLANAKTDILIKNLSETQLTIFFEMKIEGSSYEVEMSFNKK